MRMQNAKVLLANTLNYELFQWNEKKKWQFIHQHLRGFRIEIIRID